MLRQQMQKKPSLLGPKEPTSFRLSHLSKTESKKQSLARGASVAGEIRADRPSVDINTESNQHSRLYLPSERAEFVTDSVIPENDSVANVSEETKKNPQRQIRFSLVNIQNNDSGIIANGDTNGESHHRSLADTSRDAGILAMELQVMERHLSSLRDSVRDLQRSGVSDTSHTAASNRSTKPFERSTCLRDLYRRQHNPKASTFSLATHTPDTVVTFPNDCFSILAVHGPMKSPYMFGYALIVFLFQLTFLILALLSVVHPVWKTRGETDNPSDWFHFIPSKNNPFVTTTQWLALILYGLIAEHSLKEVMTAVELFPRFSKVTPEDKYGCLVFSCALRFVIGSLTVLTTILMIVCQDDVIDIILDFLAMNFISDIGEMAFEVALWGKFGPRLEYKTRQVEDRPIPDCMLRPRSNFRAIMTTIPFLLLMIAITVSQWNSTIWSTNKFKVFFFDNARVETYSGCYEGIRTKNPNGGRWKLYQSLNEEKPAKFGYCTDISRWRLFTGAYNDACSVPVENVLAFSQKTDPNTGSFDISDVFGGLWYAYSDIDGITYIDTQFKPEEDYNGKDMLCGSFWNDGHCDLAYNNHSVFYDGGDCCGSTCTKPDCGNEAVTIAFGENLLPGKFGAGFPNCEDPRMVPITIALHNIVDSCTYQNNNDIINPNCKNSSFSAIDPIEPVMMLDCDGRNMLTVQIKQTMEYNDEIVKLRDGARCIMRISNSSSSTTTAESVILYVNYTLYDGNGKESAMADQGEPIPILREQSANNEFASFNLIPKCFFTKLSAHLDNFTIYTGTNSENLAIKWLLLSSQAYSTCEEDSFIERYALSVLNFAAPMQPQQTSQDVLNTDVVMENGGAPDSLPGASQMNFPSDETSTVTTYVPKSPSQLWIIAEERHCFWSNVECNGPYVESIDMRRYNLRGTIASSIGLLTKLAKLELIENYLTGTIPSELGRLSLLKELGLHGNLLTGTIPSEIGKMSKLEIVNLSDNSLTGSIPSELENLPKLTALYVAGNPELVTANIPIGLQSVVFTNCVTERDRRRANADSANETIETLLSCQELEERYAQNDVLSVYECEELNSRCSSWE